MDLEFRRNVGNADRIIRIAAGVFLLYVAFVNPLSLRPILLWTSGIIGLASLVEGVIGY